MDHSPYSTPGQYASIEPPHLPDGWRSGELDVGPDAFLTTQRLRVLLRVALVGVVIACMMRAGRLAAALLVLEPSSKLPVTFRAPARTGQELSAKLGKAKETARHGRWREARRPALSVLAVQKDFPGAATVVADARIAFAPKPKAAAARPTSAAPVAASSAQTTSRSAASQPPQPPPP